jgi:hypothetical protein
MRFILDLWKLLNGNKTAIAGGLALTAVFLADMQTNIGVHLAWMDWTIGAINTIATYLGILGVGHKIVKINTP